MIGVPAESGPAERGFALLIVLWSLVVLALLATGLSTTGRTDAKLASNLRAAAITEAGADGAIYQAAFSLLADPAMPAQPLRFAVGPVAAEVRIEDLSGRINPNVVSPDLLGALLLELDVNSAQAASLTAAILDWVTANPRARPRGAKLAEYQAAGRHYGPPGAPLRSVDELGDVLGMTPALLARLRPHLTVWWDNEPDPAVADPIVRAALHRLGADGPATAERRPGQLRVVDLRADAAGPDGSRFTRHAVIALLPGAGRSWRVLAWDAGRS